MTHRDAINRSFLDGGGEASRLIHERDWTSHPLGPPENWPAEFRAALSLILNSPESMILTWGPEMHFFFNEAYFPLLGPRLPWAMGTPFRIVWADAWEQAKPIIEEAFAGRSQRFNDLPWKLDTDRGSANTWFTFSYSRVLDSRGDVAGLFIFTNETTERVIADASLKQSEERLRLVVEGAKDHVIFTMDPDGVITGWYPGAESVLGWSPLEAIGKHVAMIFTAEDRAAGVDRRELTLAARDGVAPDERWHLRKDGSRRFLNGSVHPLPPDLQGVPRGFIKIARDETQRRQAESDLRRSEAAALLDAQRVQLALAAGAIVGTWVWDVPADRFSADEAFARSFGLDPSLCRVGVSLDQIIVTVHPDDQPGLAVAINRAMAAGGPYAHQYRVRRPDGKYYWIEANGRVDLGPDGTPLSFPGVIIDIERRRVVEAERDRALSDLRSLNETLEQRVAERTADLMRAEDALRQAQKMEAVGQLTGGLAHDFNNLLMGISGSFEIIDRSIARGEMDRLERFLQTGKGATKRAAALTHRLLAFSRRQTLDPKPTNVDLLLAELEELIRRTVGPAVQLERVGQPGLWSTLVDPNQLENSVLNLCINARDAMPGGGRITVETANQSINDRTAMELDVAAGDYVSVSVTDTGVGMPPEVVTKAFEPFFTTKPLGEGTGLGLSMIYGFAKQSGGQVRIRSIVDQGTTVSLLLPRHTSDVLIPIDAPPTIVEPVIGDRVVMLVDDEPSVRMVIVEVLAALGYRVIDAVDGPSALRTLPTAGRVDLLITDVGLPGGLNGRQVADAARVMRPDLKVLFITGYAESAVVGNVNLESGMQLITKPFAMDALVAKVTAMIKA